MGGQRGDWLVASVCATVMNANERLMTMLAGKTRPRKAWKISEFVLRFGQPAPPRGPDSNWQRLKMIGRMWAEVLSKEANTRG